MIEVRTRAKPALHRAAPVPVGFRAVLVPLDGSRMAERALEPARWLARAFGAELHAVAAAHHRDERWWYEQYLDTIVQREPHLAPHPDSGRHPGSIISAMATSLDPCLICMSTHGRARSAALLGSTFTAVANTHPGPLVAVGPRALFPALRPATRIVACVDGTPASESVLPVAAGWALRLGFRLSVAYVAEPVPPPVVPERRRHHPYLDPDLYIGDLVQAWSGATLGEPGAGEPGAGEPRHGEPGLEVDGLVIWDPMGPGTGLDEHLAQQPAAFVAAASHLRTGVARAAHGSEVAHIIHHCPVPVLVQPVRDRAPNLRTEAPSTWRTKPCKQASVTASS